MRINPTRVVFTAPARATLGTAEAPTSLKAADFAAVVAADKARGKPVVEASGFRGD